MEQIKIRCGRKHYGIGETVLEALKDARIFSVEAISNGRFQFQELCEGDFWAQLTKDQLLHLADELRDLANTVTQ